MVVVAQRALDGARSWLWRDVRGLPDGQHSQSDRRLCSATLVVIDHDGLLRHLGAAVVTTLARPTSLSLQTLRCADPHSGSFGVPADRKLYRSDVVGKGRRDSIARTLPVDLDDFDVAWMRDPVG